MSGELVSEVAGAATVATLRAGARAKIAAQPERGVAVLLVWLGGQHYV